MKHNFENVFAYKQVAGLGIYRVIVTIDYAGENRDFSAITNNLEVLDLIDEMEDSQEKYDAYYELIESKIMNDLEEWQYEIEETESRDAREMAYEIANDYDPDRD